MDLDPVKGFDLLTMTRIKSISIAAIAIAGVVASLLIQSKSQVKFREREALLQQQEDQLAALDSEHERLSNLVANAEKVPANDHKAELAKLRNEAEALKKQTNDLGIRQSKDSREPQASRPAPVPESHTPEYWEQLRQMAGAKGIDARDIATAFYSYALDHRGQFPSNFDQIASYLAKDNRSLSGTNQFEIVYQGSLDELQGIPRGAVAVVRDRQTWQGPDGKMMRVYGMADGVGQTVGSDDNFQSWEAKHIISPRKPRQPGP